MNGKTVTKMFRHSVRFFSLLSAFVILGCNSGSGSVGKYVDEKNTKDYTELKNDGTFVVQQGALTANGKYSIDGKRLILTLNSGEVVEGKIEGKTIIDNGGSRSTKIK